MESENAHDFDTTIATIGHPRYELVATGDVYDGEDAVRAYFAESRRAFPDQRNELVALHHADDAVTMLVSHPLTVGRALARRVSLRRR
jgi:predicted SnoaL-like aldol condensation-catalyzing enzyme